MKDLLDAHSKLDIFLLEKFVEVLAPFKQVTELMSSQTAVTASLVKPLLHMLMETSKPMEGEPAVLHQAKATLYHDLEKR